jgi:hypothetical protein
MPLGNGRRTFHKCCGSLYPPQTVDALLRFPARVRINDRLGARRSAAPQSPLDCQSYQRAGPVFWHQSGKSGAVVAGPAEKRVAQNYEFRLLTGVSLGAIEGDEHFIVLRSGAHLDWEGDFAHHREVAGRIAWRDGSGDGHLVGRKRLLIRACDPNTHGKCDRPSRALGPEQHPAGEAVFHHHAIGIELAFARHLGDLAAMHDGELIANVAGLVDGEQPVARPRHDLRAMGAIAAWEVGPVVGFRRLEQLVRGDRRSRGILASGAKGIGER